MGLQKAMYRHCEQACLGLGVCFALHYALKTIEDAVYYALVTSTTLGYGDITLGKAHRILGSMAAVAARFQPNPSHAALYELAGF